MNKYGNHIKVALPNKKTVVFFSLQHKLVTFGRLSN